MCRAAIVVVRYADFMGVHAADVKQINKRFIEQRHMVSMLVACSSAVKRAQKSRLAHAPDIVNAAERQKLVDLEIFIWIMIIQPVSSGVGYVIDAIEG